jgi:hypothetical protein
MTYVKRGYFNVIRVNKLLSFTCSSMSQYSGGFSSGSVTSSVIERRMNCGVPSSGFCPQMLSRIQCSVCCCWCRLKILPGIQCSVWCSWSCSAVDGVKYCPESDGGFEWFDVKFASESCTTVDSVVVVRYWPTSVSSSFCNGKIIKFRTTLV